MKLFLLKLLVLSLLLMAFGGCKDTLPKVLYGAHTTLATAGKEIIEPGLEKTCLDRQETCKLKGITEIEKCPELGKCKTWVKTYVAAKKAAEESLATLNRLWYELVKEGVIK